MLHQCTQATLIN